MVEGAHQAVPYCCTAESINKSFRRTAVLKDCTISLQFGEAVLLLGSNGAGKSTLLKIVAGLLTPENGVVSRFGESFGYLAQDLQLYGSLTVKENLEFFASVSAQSSSVDLERWGLASYRDVAVNDLSKGLQQRVSLCRLFAKETSFLILDEPTTYLDAEGIVLFSELLKERQASGILKTVLIASHDIATIRPLVDRAVVLNAGSVALDSKVGSSLDAVIKMYQEVNR